jgi:molecular chaperone Hsp33
VQYCFANSLAESLSEGVALDYVWFHTRNLTARLAIHPLARLSFSRSAQRNHMDNPLRSSVFYLPSKQAMLVKVDLSDYLIDYYLHLKEHVGSLRPSHDSRLKQLISCFAVHLSVRPPEETVAWTLHLHAEEPFSLFVTGCVAEHFVIGYALAENIRHTDINGFHSQVVTAGGELSKSFVRCQSSKIKEMVEQFYNKSEQLPLRIYLPDDSDTALGLVAMPDYNENWFESVSLPSLPGNNTLTIKELKTCELFFSCGCSKDKLLPYFRSIDADTLDELYGSDREIILCCPRCGKKFGLERSEIS